MRDFMMAALPMDPLFTFLCSSKAAPMASKSSPSTDRVSYFFLKGPYGIEKSTFKGVVGVYQEYEVFAQVGFDVCVESLVLSLYRASERTYEAMSHSSGASAAEDASRKDVRRAGASGDYGSLGPIDCGPRSGGIWPVRGSRRFVPRCGFRSAPSVLSGC